MAPSVKAERRTVFKLCKDGLVQWGRGEKKSPPKGNGGRECNGSKIIENY